MKNLVLNNIVTVKTKIQQFYPNHKYEIIAITKTFGYEIFKPLLEAGHIHYGENKVQEAEQKWSSLLPKYKEAQLHLVGKLQTNKAKKAINLFNYIHSLDNLKLALILDKLEKELNKKCKYFIQINIGDEHQKSGVSLGDFEYFYKDLNHKTNLNIIGLMCIPPINKNPDEAFSLLRELANKFNLNELSMGMSSDYLQAINHNSTFLRLGTVLFGAR